MDEVVCCNFVGDVGTGFEPLPDEPVLDSLFEQYGRVIVQSMITSFGLDFLIADRHGGDVDTIYNVRKIGSDEKMTYKNTSNQTAYDNRGVYDSHTYHSHSGYKEKNAEISSVKKDGKLIDEYTGEKIRGNEKSDLDHIISAKEIHEDRGRVLSGLRGEDLANSSENLSPTNPHTNRTKKALSMKEFLEKYGDEYTDEQKKAMLAKDSYARKEYEAKINRAYYTSKQFRNDTLKAAGQVGSRMGLRQALGLVFTELWFAVQDEFEYLKNSNSFNLENFLTAVGRGIKSGLANAKEKYRELFSKFLEGSVAGVLSSLTTTLCNIFFTTAKNIVRIIRQSWASITEAAKILFINPDNYLLGERLRAVAKILATGASVVAGTLVAEALGNTGLKALPAGLGEIVTSFCGAFVSGILSCTFLYYLDRSELINKLVKWLDNLPSVEKQLLYYKGQVEIFERYAAQLMEIDFERFKKETAVFNGLVGKLSSAKSAQQLNLILIQEMKNMGITMSWEKTHDSFDSFMQDKSAVLRFS